MSNTRWCYVISSNLFLLSFHLYSLFAKFRWALPKLFFVAAEVASLINKICMPHILWHLGTHTVLTLTPAS